MQEIEVSARTEAEKLRAETAHDHRKKCKTVKTSECPARADLLGADRDTEELPGKSTLVRTAVTHAGIDASGREQKNHGWKIPARCCSPWKNERDPSEETSCIDGLNERVTEGRTDEHGKSRWEKSARTPAPGAGKLTGRREIGRTENKNQSRQRSFCSG
jgi:hypothetical protein